VPPGIKASAFQNARRNKSPAGIKASAFQPTIGLEVHAQLLTKSKLFCACSTRFGATANSQVCPICLGMPGVLPVLNQKAVEFAILMGLATHCTIADYSTFTRKNYFYPDLPKGYQISQYDRPLCRDGYLSIEVDGYKKHIGIQRIHLEEDAGRLIHAEAYVAKDETLVDLNRCGVPLIEIVSEPELESPRQAYLYLKSLRQILMYLEICDGNMEQGSLRCDANVSIRPIGSQHPGVKTEIKNLNSFHGVERALEFEIKRQVAIIESGGTVRQETRLWDQTRNIATTMRTKEESPDYRYFPEPDLVPLVVPPAWVARISQRMPELPRSRRKRLMSQFQLSQDHAAVLTEHKSIADYFEQVVQLVPDPKLVSHWIMGEILRLVKEQKDPKRLPVSARALAELLKLVQNETISTAVAKEVLKEMLSSGKSAPAIVEEQNLQQISNTELLLQIIAEVLEENPDQVLKYQQGKTKLFGYFVGQVMKKTRGKANPQLVNRLLQEKLFSS